MKKEAMAFLSLIISLPLINAQFFGSYGSFADLFSFIDAQTIFILICFGVLGLLLKLILDKLPAFRGTMAGTISVLISIGATYGINKLINVNDLFSDFGFSGDLLPYLLLAFLVILVFCLFKFKYKTLIILGLLLILIALFTDLVYEKEVVLIVGIVILIIGLFWWWRSRKKKIPVGAIPQSQGSQQINGMPRLIIEAKAYRQRADRQQNPKMYRNWAHFIEYLKSRGYGRNEKEICQRMMVSPSDISKVVKKYIL